MTELPDLFPDSQVVVAFPPHIAALRSGFSDLSRLDARDSRGKPIGVLQGTDRGYLEIFTLLRVFDPSIDRFFPASADSRGQTSPDIVLSEASTYIVGSRAIPIVRPVSLIDPGQPEQGPILICDMRDLALLIRDRTIRFWSRLGVGIAVLGLVFQTIPALVGRSGPLKQRSERTRPMPAEVGAVRDASAADERVHGSGSQLAILLPVFAVLAIFLLKNAGNRRQKSH